MLIINFNNKMKYLYLTLSSLIIAYLVMIIFIYFYQRNLLYHPSDNNYQGDKIQFDYEEISKMIELQYQRAIDILNKNKEKLTILAELLLEKEVIFKDDLIKIFGVRPFEDETEEAPEAKEENSKKETEKEELKEETKQVKEKQ